MGSAEPLAPAGGDHPLPPPPPSTPRRVPVQGCDRFLITLDAMMRRAGQGAQISQTILRLADLPAVDRLTDLWERFTQERPLSRARLGWDWTCLPVWRLPNPRSPRATPPPIGWHAMPSAGDALQSSLAQAGLDARVQPATSLEALALRLRDFSHQRDHPTDLLRLDLLATTAGETLLILTWSHLLFDGKGLELILTEWARSEGQDKAPGVPAPDLPLPSRSNTRSHAQNNTPNNALNNAPANARNRSRPSARTGVREQIRRSRAFVHHFYRLAAVRFRSLGGPTPAPGPCHCQVVTLDAATTARINERAARLASPLVPMPFFLAAAACAHARVHQARDGGAGPQVITLPVQTRPKGQPGALFQNHVQMLFFAMTPDDLQSVEAATASAQRQFTEMMRHRLDTSFGMMLQLMRRLPTPLYAAFLRRNMRGEIASFFHSHTGPFAPELSTLAGATLRQAWHVPAVSGPPGTGLFFSERDGCLTLSLSWRAGAITPTEQALLLASAIEALTGEPAHTRAAPSETLQMSR